MLRAHVNVYGDEFETLFTFGDMQVDHQMHSVCVCNRDVYTKLWTNETYDVDVCMKSQWLCHEVDPLKTHIAHIETQRQT